jgi:hypothetical protein
MDPQREQVPALDWPAWTDLEIPFDLVRGGDRTTVCSRPGPGASPEAESPRAFEPHPAASSRV